MITITIDGKEVQAQPGELLTDAARRAGIEIPVFCSHPKLDPLGACRMCMVESEGPRGRALVTACTTPVTAGGVYHYSSPRAVDAREGTLELILINHPLDCPICDKGGECPLQNQTLEHGPGKSHFWEVKTHKAKNYPLSDLILIDQERCIVCWRCIRYLQEWEGKPQLGLFHRGGQTVIDKFPDGELDAYTSGSIIDLCPVGALTNRLARFSYRPWEMESTDSICTHCGQGCNLRVDARSHTVRRHVGRENMAVNDEWICDKGRFATGFSAHPQRLQEPLARINGQLQPVSWADALARVAAGLKRVVGAAGPQAVGALGSAKLSNEANYLLAKFMRVLVGTNNLDFREGSAVLAPSYGMPALADARTADVIVLLGCDPNEEAPVLATFLHRAVTRQGAKLIIVHPRAIELTRHTGSATGVFLQPAPGEETALFDALARATTGVGDLNAPLGFDPAAITHAAGLLAAAERPFILYGQEYAWGRGAEAIVASLTAWIASAGHSDRLGFLHTQANAQGAGDVGMLPDQLPGRRSVTDAAASAALGSLWGGALPLAPGLGYGAMIDAARDDRLRALYVMGTDPVGEKPADGAALQKLDFLVVQDLFLTETAKLADVVLPAASYLESTGTFTNTERRVQAAPQAIRPVGKAVADWAILMHLARVYTGGQKTGWDTPTAASVFAEICQAVPGYAGMSWESLGSQGQQAPRPASNDAPASNDTPASPAPSTAPLLPSAEFPFRLVVGSLLWDEGAMLATTPAMKNLGIHAAWLHPEDAAHMDVPEGGQVEIRSRAGAVQAPVHLDSAIKPGCVFLPYSLPTALVGVIFDENAPRTVVAVRKVGP